MPSASVAQFMRRRPAEIVEHGAGISVATQKNTLSIALTLLVISSSSMRWVVGRQTEAACLTSQCFLSGLLRWSVGV